MSAVLRRLRSRLTWHGECVCGWDYTDATRTTCRGPRDCPNSVRPALWGQVLVALATAARLPDERADR